MIKSNIVTEKWDLKVYEAIARRKEYFRRRWNRIIKIK